MSKLISIVTATRAEYGLLKPIINKLSMIDNLTVNFVVTGTHLSPEFGLTYKDIENDGFQISEKIEIIMSSDTPNSVSKSMGLAMISFADYFTRMKPDLLLLIGDRYEAMAVAVTATNHRIPIAHLYGGETTEGAIDESFRHSITKMSYLHFTSTYEHRNRVIQLGEHPSRVFNVGAIGIENVLNEKLLTKKEIHEKLNIDRLKSYALATFHPVTLESNSTEKQIENLLEVFKLYDNLNFIITKANADTEGRIINSYIDKYAKEYSNIFAFTSLGTLNYLSALKYAKFVIGNSSSGLIEAPSLGIPTINIGDRQKGRVQADSVINCEPEREAIKNAIDSALRLDFSERAKKVVNPYGDGKTTEKIVEIICDYLFQTKIDLKKKFFDYELEKSVQEK